MKIINLTTAAVILTAAVIFQECSRPEPPEPECREVVFPIDGPFNKLSEYCFFESPLANLDPNDEVLPYELNMPLFSDYAEKQRFIYIPNSLPAVYREIGAFEFQAGTMLIKIFYFDYDDQRKLVETRLLIKYEKGWDAFAYAWREDQSDADLIVEGRTLDLINPVEPGKTFSYKIPNKNQCKGCHSIDGKFTPIGPKARNLNRDLDYANGIENQLTKWYEIGVLSGMPPLEDMEEPFPHWDDLLDGTIEKRARAYLDVNCAHCHNERGPANNTGLFLNYDQEDKYRLGICKQPIAPGKGTGGFKYDVVPGSANTSIIVFRMESDDPGIRMPETGRALVHQKGVELINRWIDNMSESPCE
jgi:uncharacterized repeat protein (TIGR03806 family)